MLLLRVRRTSPRLWTEIYLVRAVRHPCAAQNEQVAWTGSEQQGVLEAVVQATEHARGKEHETPEEVPEVEEAQQARVEPHHASPPQDEAAEHPLHLWEHRNRNQHCPVKQKAMKKKKWGGQQREGD